MRRVYLNTSATGTTTSARALSRVGKAFGSNIVHLSMDAEAIRSTAVCEGFATIRVSLENEVAQIPLNTTGGG